MTLYLLDSNAVSAMIHDALGPVGARAVMVGDAEVGTSAIVAAEIRYGAAKKRSALLTDRVKAVLGAIEISAFEASAAEIYGELRAEMERSGDVIGQSDLLIAAHALSLDSVLVTDNEREFARVPGLKVENWLRSE